MVDTQQAVTGIAKAEIMKPAQIFQSSALPINSRVSDKIKDKIWANEYINLGQLTK